MNRNVTSIVLLGLFLLLPKIAESGGPNLKEGLWEITVTMEMKGMPMQMPTQKFTQCITKDRTVPHKEDPGQECKIVKNEVKGDTVTWAVECKTPEGTVVSDGTVTYKGDTFDGVTRVSMPDSMHGKMLMTQRMKGKWVGKCQANK